jgi:hypothetical protein
MNFYKLTGLPDPFAGIETNAKAIGSRPTCVQRPADPNILVANDVKRKVRMATPVGFEAKRQEYEAQYGGGSNKLYCLIA